MKSFSVMSFLENAFRPPFKGLAVLVWSFFVWCYLAHPGSQILHGTFADSDDIVHLLRVTDWLKGQSWFDPMLHRLSPPEGVPIHYSRLYELPLAALIGPLHRMGMDWIEASYAAAAIWPPLLLIALFYVLRWMAEPLVPRDWARATAYIVLFCSCLMFEFSPGRVDHHGFSAILVAAALGCVLRVMRDPADLKHALGAGFFLALGQAIALETLPWLLMLSGWMGLWTMAKGRSVAGQAVLFGLSLYVFSFLTLTVTVSQATFYALNPLAYSYLYVLISGGLALILGAIAGAALLPRTFPRVAVGLIVPPLAAAAFFAEFPALAKGPYGGMNPELARLMLPHIVEAVPLIRTATGWKDLASFLPIPLLGLVASVRFMLKEEGEGVWKWLLMSLLMTASMFLMVAYQVRSVLFAQLFAVVPLVEFLRRGLARAHELYRGRRLAAAELALIIAVGPFAGVLLLAMVDNRPFNTGVLLFPVVFKADRTCTPDGLWQALNLKGSYGDRPRVIMNMMNEGAAILFHTPHSAMAAPYHTNVKGNLDSIHFFHATDPAEAEKIARADKVDLVLMCAHPGDLYRDRNNDVQVKISGKKKTTEPPNFAQQLADRKVPAWLHQVELPFLGDALLFEVKPKS